MRRTAVVLILAAGASLLSVAPAGAGAPTTGACPAPFIITTQGPIDEFIKALPYPDPPQEMLDAQFDFIDKNLDLKVCWNLDRGTIIENRAQNG